MSCTADWSNRPHGRAFPLATSSRSRKAPRRVVMDMPKAEDSSGMSFVFDFPISPHCVAVSLLPPRACSVVIYLHHIAVLQWLAECGRIEVGLRRRGGGPNIIAPAALLILVALGSDRRTLERARRAHPSVCRVSCRRVEAESLMCGESQKFEHMSMKMYCIKSTAVVRLPREFQMRCVLGERFWVVKHNTP